MPEVLKHTCPACTKIFKYPQELSGRNVRCPACKQAVKIPDAEHASSKPHPPGNQLDPDISANLINPHARNKSTESTPDLDVTEIIHKTRHTPPSESDQTNSPHKPAKSSVQHSRKISSPVSVPNFEATNNVFENTSAAATIAQAPLSDANPYDRLAGGKEAKKKKTVEIRQELLFTLVGSLVATTLLSLGAASYLLMRKAKNPETTTSSIPIQPQTSDAVSNISASPLAEALSASSVDNQVEIDVNSDPQMHEKSEPKIDFLKERESGILAENLEIFQVLDEVDNNVGKCFLFDGVTIWFDIEKTDKFDGFQMNVTDRRKQRHTGFGNTFLFVINKKMADAIRRDFPANKGVSAKIYCQVRKGGESPVAEIFKFASLSTDGEIVDEYYDDGNWKYIGGAK